MLFRDLLLFLEWTILDYIFTTDINTCNVDEHVKLLIQEEQSSSLFAVCALQDGTLYPK